MGIRAALRRVGVVLGRVVGLPQAGRVVDMGMGPRHGLTGRILVRAARRRREAAAVSGMGRGRGVAVRLVGSRVAHLIGRNRVKGMAGMTAAARLIVVALLTGAVHAKS